MGKSLLILLGLAVLLCATIVSAQENNDDEYQEEKGEPGSRRLSAEESQKQEKENENNELSDAELDENNIPKSLSAAELARLSRTSKVKVDASEAVSLRPQFLPFIMKCCPRHQNYGCRSVYRRMPCTRFGTNICCPLGIQRQVSYCNCRECALHKPDCIEKGTCQKRWVRRAITHYCYNFATGTASLMSVFRSYPVSCYCRERGIVRELPLTRG